MSGPYRVEEDDAGCSDCGHGKTWHVVGPDEMASSTSYGDEDEARSLKNALDNAYELGRSTVPPSINVPWTRFSWETLPPAESWLLVWDDELSMVNVFFCSDPKDAMGSASKFKYSHWTLTAGIARPPASKLSQPPKLVPVTVLVPVPAETAADPDFTDDIPF